MNETPRPGMCSCACLSLRAVGLDSRRPEVQSVVTVGPCAHGGASWIHRVLSGTLYESLYKPHLVSLVREKHSLPTSWSWVYGFPVATVTNGTHLVPFLAVVMVGLEAEVLIAHADLRLAK